MKTNRPEVHIRREEVEKCQICETTPTNRGIYVTRLNVPGLSPEEQEICLDFCAKCNYAWQNPRPSQLSLDAYYTHCGSASGQVLGALTPDCEQITRAKKRLMWFRSRSRVELQSAQLSILDVGAGNGAALWAYLEDAPTGQLVAAVEPARSARENLGLRGIAAWEDLGSISAVKTFSIIFLFSVLEHVSDPVSLISRLKSLLSTDGEIWVTVPDSCRPRSTLGEFYGFEHLHHFSHRTIRVIGANSELSLTDKETLDDGALVAIFSKTDRGTTSKIGQDGPETADLKTEIEKYKRKKELAENRVRRLVDNSLEAAQTGRKLVVWGAGQHSAQIFANRKEDLAPVFCFADFKCRLGQPEIFMSRPVLHPDDIVWQDIDDVFISSESFNRQIEREARRRASHCRIINPYNSNWSVV